jgi:hypothetical protein
MTSKGVDSMAKACVITVLVLVLSITSCKDTSQDGGSEQAGQTDSNNTQNSGGDQNSARHPPGWVPITTKLPSPAFGGTPANIEGVEDLEEPRDGDRPPFYAPADVENVAAGKRATSSDPEPIVGKLDYITDGDKEAVDGSFVELAPFRQSVTIDLGDMYEIYAVLMWHYHQEERAYFDVVVRVADDSDFVTNVRALFNNDRDNSLGFGIGSDKHYVETSEGKLINAKGAKARYVRLYSNGNSSDGLNHYIEVEVFGRAAK